MIQIPPSEEMSFIEEQLHNADCKAKEKKYLSNSRQCYIVRHEEN